MISPVLFFNLVMGIIASLNVFDTAWIATKGGPANASWFISLQIYVSAFRSFEMGYASALSWLLALVVLAITLIQFRVSGRWVFYQGGARMLSNRPVAVTSIRTDDSPSHGARFASSLPARFRRWRFVAISSVLDVRHRWKRHSEMFTIPHPVSKESGLHPGLHVPVYRASLRSVVAQFVSHYFLVGDRRRPLGLARCLLLLAVQVSRSRSLFHHHARHDDAPWLCHIDSQLSNLLLARLDQHLQPLVIPAFLGGGAFNIFLMRQFLMTIPIEFDEAAEIDGAIAGRSSGTSWCLSETGAGDDGDPYFCRSVEQLHGPLIYLTSDENTPRCSVCSSS